MILPTDDDPTPPRPRPTLLDVPVLTAHQVRMAMHALGVDADTPQRRWGYRNGFTTSGGGTAGDTAWADMAARGLAVARGPCRYAVTRAGALALRAYGWPLSDTTVAACPC